MLCKCNVVQRERGYVLRDHTKLPSVVDEKRETSSEDIGRVFQGLQLLSRFLYFLTGSTFTPSVGVFLVLLKATLQYSQVKDRIL